MKRTCIRGGYTRAPVTASGCHGACARSRNMSDVIADSERKPERERLPDPGTSVRRSRLP